MGPEPASSKIVKIYRFLRKSTRFLRKFAAFCGFLRKFADFCENLQVADFAKICKLLRKSVNWQGGWTEAFLGFCENAEESVMLSFEAF